MREVELVIKIPEEEYNIIKKSNAPMSWAEYLIKNGIPLPKGIQGCYMVDNEVEK